MKVLYTYFNKSIKVILILALCCIFQANIQAQFANDVGIIAVNSPQSQCGLGNETVEVTIQNFGLNPQALIPLNFTVNGVASSVVQPIDGVYTGVLGTDSIATFTFDAPFDFSAEGVYTIAAFTQLEGDMDLSNDTTYFVVENILTVGVLPYYNNFESSVNGWSVDENDPTVQNSTWDFGTPSTPNISGAASGNNAWVTNLSGDHSSNELSYILSPCMNFSNVTVDPVISFSINFDTELSYDGAWLEGSVDGGVTWDKVGTIGQGLNWYNFDNTNQDLGEVWAGNSNGWIFAKDTLQGYTEQADVRFRFAFDSDGSIQNDGVAIDDIYIGNPVATDIGVASVSNSDMSLCGSEMDSIVIEIRNFGTQAQSGFDVSYQIDNGPIVTENVGSLIVNPDEIATYTFSETFNSNAFNTIFEINSWTNLSSELFAFNDSTSYNLASLFPAPLPIVEDFEDAVLPMGWVSDGTVGDGHNNTSFVIFDNMYSFDPDLEITSPILGPINPGDSLTFDYRYTDWSAGTDPTTLAGDELNVQISNDCGETFTTIFTIDQNNHTPSAVMTNRLVDLDAYAGEYIQVRFFATWGAGDYWLDVDNINIIGCPIDFAENTVITDATPGSEDGSAMVNPTQGQAPYEYTWSNGATSNPATDLAQGDYIVTVVDANGCMNVVEVTIGTFVSTDDVQVLRDIVVAPNPTSGSAFLNLSFNTPVELKVEVLNMVGQTVFAAKASNTIEESYEVDLTNYSSGMYFIRLSMDNETHVEKLIRM